MKIRAVALGITLIVLSSCVFQTSIAQPLTKRLIRRLPIEKNEPIEITEIKVNDQRVSFDKKFTADDDWLRGLVVSIQNKSDKRILFASIQLQFPGDVSGRIPIYEIWHGNRSLEMRTPSKEDRLAGITSGATVDIGLSDQQFSELTKFLEMTGARSNVERLDIRINRVIFQDDIMWTRGEYARRDPKDPTTWVRRATSNLNS